jgi:hypothetical protein
MSQAGGVRSTGESGMHPVVFRDQGLDLGALRFRYRLANQHFVPNMQFKGASHHQYVEPAVGAAKGIRFQRIAHIAAVMEFLQDLPVVAFHGSEDFFRRLQLIDPEQSAGNQRDAMFRPWLVTSWAALHNRA